MISVRGGNTLVTSLRNYAIGKIAPPSRSNTSLYRTVETSSLLWATVCRDLAEAEAGVAPAIPFRYSSPSRGLRHG